MIITVFVTTDSVHDQWRAELLEHSWMQAGQPGELVRLVACPPDTALPMHAMARVVRTPPYCPHPYLQDDFPGYDLPAALMHWLFGEQIDATLLVLDIDSIMLDPVSDELTPGGAIGNPWRAWPKGDGPMGLGKGFDKLKTFCINPALNPPKVRLPVLIHSHDLKKIVARWLELTALIRHEAQRPSGKIQDAQQIAYTIAAAEFRVKHQMHKLAVVPSDRKADRPILDYRTPVESARGEIVWDPEIYAPWSPGEPAKAKAGVGRVFLENLQAYIQMRESGEHLRLRRARRCHGVREAHLPDRMVLEVPGAEQLLNLNLSAAAIWQLCDSQRSLAQIADVLEQRYEVPRDQLCRDIDMTITYLHTGGAVDLEAITL